MSLRFRSFLFLLLLLVGVLPVALNTYQLVEGSRDTIESQEKSHLVGSTESAAEQLSSGLSELRQQLAQLANAVRLAPGSETLAERLQEPWVREFLGSFLSSRPELVTFRMIDFGGRGLKPTNLSAELQGGLNDTFDQALSTKDSSYRVIVDPRDGPAVLVTVPQGSGDDDLLIVQAAVPLERFLTSEGVDQTSVLVDRDGTVLWSDHPGSEALAAVLGSKLVSGFVAGSRVGAPPPVTAEYELKTAAGAQEMLGQVSQVRETGWGLIVQKPRTAALGFVTGMVKDALRSTFFLAMVALGIAVLAARTLSRPIQDLTETAHSIAAGELGKRANASSYLVEIRELGSDFNRMSERVEVSIDQLREAAAQNEELFIGSIRALAAAIDAKDPYTRGHSERVAEYSRTIARYLSKSDTHLERIWIGGILHDVGKIGVEDQVLKKEGLLTDDEFEQIKRHTVIGAEIMSTIEQLNDIIPIIRSHHEAWNGSGYPDGLRGEQIPLTARIVGLADTFDAITTNRPYQNAYDAEYAVKTIKKLTGTRFDAKVVTAFLQAYADGKIQPPVDQTLDVVQA